MVKLRLIPVGKTAQPSFRVVAMDSRVRRNGKYIKILGNYDSIKKTVKLDEELTLQLLLTGAQPTVTVRDLLSKQGILTKFHNIKQDQQKAKVAAAKVKKANSSEKPKVAKPKTAPKKAVIKKVTKKTTKTTEPKTTQED